MLFGLAPVAIVTASEPSPGTGTSRTAAPAVEAFARLPPIEGVRLSPDGNRLLMLVAIDGAYHVGLRDLRTGESRILMAADPDEFRFEACRFANDLRVVCSIRSPIELRSGDHGMFLRYLNNGRTIARRLLAVDVDGTNVLQLVPRALSRPGRDLVWNAVDQGRVLSWLPGDPDHILLQIAREDRVYPSVYRLDIRTNDMTRVLSWRTGVLRWYADDAGEVRFAGGWRGGTPFALARQDDGWIDIDVATLGGVEPPCLLAFAEDGASAWVLANAGADTRGVHRVSLATGEVLETLFSDPRFDAGGLHLDPLSGVPLAVSFVADRPTLRWLDASLGARFDAVARALPGAPSRVALMDADDALRRFVLHAEGNGTVPTWYLYDGEARQVVPLARTHAGIGVVVESTVIRFPARDGLEIPAYLTRPSDASGPLPTVLLPHGGPWARDTGAFDYQVQLLVSRGYVVLQPNYRGSSGYGDDWLRRGFEQWGLAMQDDLMDGLDWLIAEGITDPERVCIVGASYGGYAALVASFRAPERFRCAVAFAGVADLDVLDNHWRAYGLGDRAAARIQNGPARDRVSPVRHARDIRVPLLIVHGGNDRMVHPEQAEALVAALDAAGRPYRYIAQPGGDHHLSSEADRLQFLAAMDSFLAEHLGRR
ncbi:MAG TPA: S9 family peptidase [Pseudomonadales bacterium]|nr:S9 family peptidase [Pseudomonadales bacterium]